MTSRKRTDALTAVTKALREGRVTPDEAPAFVQMHERDAISTELIMSRREATSTGLFDRSEVRANEEKPGTGLFQKSDD